MEGIVIEKELRIDTTQLKRSALMLRAINHKLRQQMMKLIHGHGRMTVTEIYVKLRLEQSVASQHLAILRRSGYVLATREGKFIYYSVNTTWLKEVHAVVNGLLQQNVLA